MASVKDKVIAITGAASGIGWATAILLAERGANLSLADVQEKQLQAVSSEIKQKSPSCKVTTTVVDVRDQKAVRTWIEDTVKEFGRLDGAANLAGVHKTRPNPTIEEDDDDLWNWMLSVNIMGVLNCMRAQIPNMVKGASIVNAASVLAIQGAPGAAAYSASKHGVLGMSRSAAKDVGPRGVRVNCFAPGYINTPMLRSSFEERGTDTSRAGGWESVALKRQGEPREVACLVAFLLSDDASFITGVNYSIDGGWNC